MIIVCCEHIFIIYAACGPKWIVWHAQSFSSFVCTCPNKSVLFRVMRSLIGDEQAVRYTWTNDDPVQMTPHVYEPKKSHQRLAK